MSGRELLPSKCLLEKTTDIFETLRHLSELAQAVQIMLIEKSKFAERRMSAEYVAIGEQLELTRKQTQHRVVTLHCDRILEIDKLAQIVTTTRNATSQLIADVKKAIEVDDPRLTTNCQHRLQKIINESNLEHMQDQIASCQHMELMPTEGLAKVQSELGKELHFLKTSALNPDDLQLVLACNLFSRGVPLQVQVTQSRTEPLSNSLISVHVVDFEGKYQPIRMDPVRQSGRIVRLIISFVPTSFGSYSITAKIYGQSIRGSPLNIVVDQDETNNGKNPDQVASSQLVASMILSSNNRKKCQVGQKIIKREADINSDVDLTLKLDAIRLENPVKRPESQVFGSTQMEMIAVDAPKFDLAPKLESTRSDLPDLGAMMARGNGIVAVPRFQVGRLGISMLNRPIGCTFDEALNSWIVCDTGSNMIRLFDTELRLVQSLNDRELFFPSAVCIVEHGRFFAVKDDRQIILYDIRAGKNVGSIARDLNKPMGLALDGHCHLVTLAMSFYGKRAEIHSYDRRNPFTPILKYPYNGSTISKPRFIDVRDSKLVVTDLGVNQVHQISLLNGQIVNTFGRKGVGPGMFDFVSGVRIDKVGNMLIGDAKNKRIQLFDSTGQFKCQLRIAKSPGFVSDLHLTTGAQMMAVDRYGHAAMIYQLGPF